MPASLLARRLGEFGDRPLRVLSPKVDVEMAETTISGIRNDDLYLEHDIPVNPSWHALIDLHRMEIPAPDGDASWDQPYVWLVEVSNYGTMCPSLYGTLAIFTSAHRAAYAVRRIKDEGDDGFEGRWIVTIDRLPVLGAVAQEEVAS